MNFSFMKKLLCIAAYYAIADCAFAASSLFDFTVTAGQRERNHVPVKVAVPRGQIGGEPITSVILTRPDGQQIPAQWTGPGLISTAAGELHFILPHLGAGESLR